MFKSEFWMMTNSSIPGCDITNTQMSQNNGIYKYFLENSPNLRSLVCTKLLNVYWTTEKKAERSLM